MPKVEWHGDLIQRLIEEAALDGAEEWARADVLPLSQENCPTASGTMKGTGSVVREDKIIEIGFGGPAAPYTVRQHEDLTLNHPSGQHKCLENAFNWQKPKLPEKVGDRLKRVL
jgi:hypothetical protein